MLQNQKSQPSAASIGASNPVEAAEGCDLGGTENIQHVVKIRKGLKKRA
ncbi:hypothetical protein [Pseudomonas sp. JL3]|nr:hypothetical protein [Pseudomonas sp. JL3]MDR8367160.1 hypothetical protein [Pseudomonas sp. JL3]